MNANLADLFWVIGSLFMLLAALGLVRLPDLFTRMQAAAKASTLGVVCVFLGTACYFGELGIGVLCGLIVFFFFLTAPVGAHMLARAAYFVWVPLWKDSVQDDLKGHYDRKTHALD